MSMFRAALVLPLFLTSLYAEDFTVFHAPDMPREQLVRYLNGLGARFLRERAREISRIETREDLERRKNVVRHKILGLIGGLPDYRGPLHVKAFGTLERGDYRIEKIVYESLPGFYVTANVYVPARG